MGTTGTAEPSDLRHMTEAWGEDIFPAPPEDQRAKDAAAADVLRRAAVPHLLACADEIERLRVLADANRQRGEEIANLRVVVEHYSMEPCEYVEEGRCSDPAQSLALEEFCGPCSARHVLSDPV